MAQADSPKINCQLWIEALLGFQGLRDGAICLSCSSTVGMHPSRPSMNSFKFITRSTKYSQSQIDCQPGVTNETINQQTLNKGNHTLCLRRLLISFLC